MTQISSRLTAGYKRAFPAFWFGLLSVFLCVFLWEGIVDNNFRATVPALAIAIGLGAAGYLMLKVFVLDLVDEVWDCGNELLVRNQGKEQRIAFSDCTKVRYNGVTNPPRVTLLLRCPSKFGSKIAFIPPMRVLQFKAPPIVEILHRRIDSARATCQ